MPMKHTSQLADRTLCGISSMNINADTPTHIQIPTGRLAMGTCRPNVNSELDRLLAVAPKREFTGVLGRAQALRSAPALGAPAAAWTRPPRARGMAFIGATGKTELGTEDVRRP